MTPEQKIDLYHTTVIRHARAANPNAEKPDPSGEPPWHKMHDDYEPEPDTLGTMACPKCGAELRYAISSYNGHVRAKCSTPKCLGFMQ